MTLCFTLSMPSNNAWNGRWSGDGVAYTRTRKWSTKVGKERAAKILARRSYTYSFGDGWVASVSVKEVTPAERRKIDKSSKGFYGYDWMIDSIINHGDIYAEPPVKAQA